MSSVVASGPFDLITGLPVHPLVVHFAVVLLPLAAIGLIVIVFVKKWQRTFGWLVLAGLFVGFGASFVSKESGEALAARMGLPAEHARWGDILPFVALALLVIAAVWFWLVRQAAKKPKDVSPIAVNLAAGAAVVLAVIAVGMTIVVGHTGAEAAWQGRVPGTSGSGTSGSGTSGSGTSPSPTRTVTPSATASAATGSAAAGSYTLAQVAQHGTPSDCWSVVDGNVYDLTAWISQHPGGQGPIEGMCGVDATTAFHGQHGSQPRPNNELASFQIGTLAG